MGFQCQRDLPTIQSMVEATIKRVTQQGVTIIGAGRTDRGVHATGQVIAFDVCWRHDDLQLLKAINASLPDDIALQSISQCEGFHPRFDARSRTYTYTVLVAAQRQPLLINRAWQISQPLDLKAMQVAAHRLIGIHDFAAFGRPPQGTNSVREVMRSEWTLTEGGRYVYEIEATAFLYNMVRRIVGTLVDVGRGHIDLLKFDTIFRSAELSQAKTLAPPQGLVFKQVKYTIDKTENVETPPHSDKTI